MGLVNTMVLFDPLAAELIKQLYVHCFSFRCSLLASAPPAAAKSTSWPSTEDWSRSSRPSLAWDCVNYEPMWTCFIPCFHTWPVHALSSISVQRSTLPQNFSNSRAQVTVTCSL